MPNIQGAKKANRQNKRHRALNAIQTKAYKSALKNYRKAVLANLPANELTPLFSILQKTIDKAAKKNVISKNKAARLKSRTAHFVSTKSSKASS